jgi:hypothetical protein
MAIPDLRYTTTDASILQWLITENESTAARRALFKTGKEELDYESMSRPVSTQEAFVRFGTFLGTLPFAAITIRILMENSPELMPAIIYLIVIGIMAAITTFVGRATAGLVAKIVIRIERFRWSTMLPLLPLVGFLWGAVAGSAGGAIGFGIGAVFGFCIGGILGLLTVPGFVVVHRLLQRAGHIEHKHLLPLSLGIVLTLCAYIIGIG